MLHSGSQCNFYGQGVFFWNLDQFGDGTTDTRNTFPSPQHFLYALIITGIAVVQLLLALTPCFRLLQIPGYGIQLRIQLLEFGYELEAILFAVLQFRFQIGVLFNKRDVFLIQRLLFRF
ncbi:hypothetical protein SDC9_79108 [bioreactor metagenome]|uniref:Uncharacterized protein n=1 Tax=bioreactor metagenome TaxID=1076179 RepID=A0A644Z323_9ZZZZ